MREIIKQKLWNICKTLHHNNFINHIAMSSLFTRIINKEIPCYTIREDEKTLCFLDINPMQAGHCIVVPKIEVDHFMDVPEEYIHAVTNICQKVSRALKKTTWCKRVVSTILGFHVPHFHQHLIPVNSMKEYDWWLCSSSDESALFNMQKQILQNL